MAQGELEKALKGNQEADAPAAEEALRANAAGAAASAAGAAAGAVGAAEGPEGAVGAAAAAVGAALPLLLQALREAPLVLRVPPEGGASMSDGMDIFVEQLAGFWSSWCTAGHAG